MEKEIAIEEHGPMQDISEETVQLPMNYLSIGTTDKDHINVYIRQPVLAALEKYALSDTKNELGSILLGSYSKALGQTSVIISEYIQAKYTDASASTLTFTHETWDYVHKEHAEKWPDLRIVGWQHTHPGYGIFLSNYDMFIQENFFNLPFQVAYVIDPIQNIRGFFGWKDGRVEKLSGYYIYDEPGKSIVTPTEGEERPFIEKNTSPTFKSALSKKTKAIIATLGVICVALAAATGLLYQRLSEINAQIQELFSNQHTIQEQLQSNTQNQSAFNSEVAEKINLIGSELEDIKDSIVSVQEQIVDTAQKEDAADNTVYVFEYYVEESDTLQTICDSHNLDYEEVAARILEINGLNDESEIVPGQTILIPFS